MKTYKRNGYIVRVISLTVAIAFFFEQLVWAGDMILSPPIDPELPLYPDIDIAYGYAETIVKTKQGIEDFVHVNIGDDDEGQGPGEEISSLGFSDAPELSVEVSEGSVVFYSNGNASRIERPDGTIIRFIDTGKNTVTLSDGTVYVWGGDDDGGHFAKGMGKSPEDITKEIEILEDIYNSVLAEISSAERYAEDTEGESIPIKEEIRVIGIEHDSLTKEIDEQQEIYEKYSVLHENDIVLSEDKRECLSSAERLFLEKKAAYDGDLSALEEEKNIKEAELDETIRFIGTLNEGEILTADQAEAVFLVKLIVDEAEEDLMSAEAELELKQREYDTFLSARDEAYREYIEAKKIAGHAEWLKGLVCSIVEWWRKRQYDRAENEHIKALALLEAAKTNRALAAEAKDKALEYFNDIKVWIKNDNSKTYDDACVKKDTLQNEMDDIIFRTKAAETTLDLARKDRISAEKEYREALERELASSVVLDSQKDRLDGLKASLAELSGDLDGLKILLAEKEKEKKEAHTLLAGLKEQELCIFYELYEKRSEKDLYEENLKKVLAAVEQAEADLLEAEEILRIRGDIYVEVRDNGDKAVYKLKGMEYVVSTILCTDGTFIEYEYNENNETISCAKTLSSGDVEIYGSDGRLDKKYSADAGFVK